MKRVLVLYPGHQSHLTRGVINLTKALRGHSVRVDVSHVDQVSEEVHFGNYDAVLIGTSAHIERQQQRLARFVREYRPVLDDLTSAFFTVSMASDPSASVHTELESALRFTRLDFPRVKLSSRNTQTGETFASLLAEELTPSTYSATA